MVFLIRYFINLQRNLLIMSELKSKPPLSFWFISILALVWNIKGVISFIGIIFISDENLNLLSVTKRISYVYPRNDFSRLCIFNFRWYNWFSTFASKKK